MSALPPGDGDKNPGRQNFVNLVVLIAIALLVILGYWAFNALEQGRKFQQCLDSGRRNCADYVGPAK